MKKMHKQVRFHLKSKHLLGIMTLFCISCMLAAFAAGISTAPLQEGASLAIVPFEKSILGVSSFFSQVRQRMREKEEILFENEELKAQIDTLISENNKLIQDQEEYTRLKELYKLDQDYLDYPKVAARIISKDPGNWYDTFIINRGSRDGIRVNNNVIAQRGLVGIVTEVGSRWATVRSIIDDSSSVSAMTITSADNFVVHGDLELIDEGKLKFEQLYDVEGIVTAGERVVTSNISENYVEGLFIGYINEVVQDSNNLTKTGTIVPPIDFAHLRDVFVITVNKQDSMSEESGYGDAVIREDSQESGEDGQTDPEASEEEYYEDEDYYEGYDEDYEETY